MNSLLSYGNGSDDDYDDSSEEKQDLYAPLRNVRKPGQPRQEDVNYDEVQMSLSEDSSDEAKPARDTLKRQSRDGEDTRRNDAGRRSASTSRDDYHSRKDRPDRRDDRYVAGRSDRDDDRSSRHRENNREEDRTRERYRAEKEDDRGKDRREERRPKSKERYSNRDDRYRDRKDRDRRKSRSPRDRDRRRSRSPRRSRSRSKSKDRSGRGGYSKRYDRASSKMERLDKMGIEIKRDDCHSMSSDPQKPGEENKDRFFVPGITGRFREQIEKRKLLWQKKEPERQETVTAAASVANPGGPRATKVWEATTFAQDTDGKVANKFKRLMGIKNAGEGSNTGTEVLKKQEEMFSSMEQQYEVARTATHTMRGVGLGFGSFQR